ncbi:site-specific tyrosine recombinase XerD [Rhodococcus sp. BP-149]|jgi:integrase/recombinase XerD|uniref:site-specific tyrosine recombinase XerD n=1 Tax=unclassified Rhodococcus (in: high G+C Gram-positive bacteria) TaxID=192944 RepID=UPI001C9A882E|nr:MULTISPECIES: site-specific tyrosine recombinase XerD [unclassified Rhodococcus (in: high G+C Gram-positive bacteria)]MBY6675309.1 site-specific tyrosine recombinase XerD [Rhodococcus sp. BP-332]MBY6686817.1 site-specific tyrosine recombinase XerD [Rhodococcus sp. BP-288]MBY6694130.1 site-specific tyrosine recombinase XerD [Rhodococcus sp. BP-188]MBY6698929.1 site-specific tyrosine recombinase XerD [Rhodococcus sp. BP-285]MBY6702537.1 site-specific tyrosine recombinase XerD [Rhodococcus sp.
MAADSPGEVIATYLDHLAVERGSARNTITSYRRDLSRYASHLGELDRNSLRDVTEVDVAEFVTALRSGNELFPPLAASSAARTVIAVRGVHRFALAEGIVDVDVAAGVKPPAPGRRLPKSLSVEQVFALLDAVAGEAADTPRGLRDRALLELLYSTGARISEAVGLDVDDIDSDSRSVVLHGKGGKERIVPIGRPALDAVDAYLVRGRPALVSQGTPALLLNVRGGRLSRQSAWQVLQTAAERAGIGASVSPHTLRHSFATHLLDGGADVRVVQELLGHASVTTTQIYTLVTVTTLREVWAEAHPRAR